MFSIIIRHRHFCRCLFIYSNRAVPAAAKNTIKDYSASYMQVLRIHEFVAFTGGLNRFYGHICLFCKLCDCYFEIGIAIL